MVRVEDVTWQPGKLYSLDRPVTIYTPSDPPNHDYTYRGTDSMPLLPRGTPFMVIMVISHPVPGLEPMCTVLAVASVRGVGWVYVHTGEKVNPWTT